MALDLKLSLILRSNEVKPDARFSIVTPTFNRRQTITRSLDASLAFAVAIGDAEIIVVDDGSTDGTADLIDERYAVELAAGQMNLLAWSSNRGVTAARNAACQVAKGEWLVFVDSDDELIAANATAVSQFADAHNEAPILFFRCEAEDGGLIGPAMPVGPMDLKLMAARGTPGECLPVVRRSAMLAHPFDEDLRGWEALAYLRIVHSCGPAMLSDEIVRRYGTCGHDRLSTLAGRMRRAHLMARGFSRLLAEFGWAIPLRHRLASVLRAGGYMAIGLLRLK